MKYLHMIAVSLALLCSPMVLKAQVGGSGTTNFIPKWTASTTLGNSRIFQAASNTCTGSNFCGVGIGTTTPSAHLHVLINQSGRGATAKVENLGPFSAAVLELKAEASDKLNDWSIVAQDNGGGTTEGLRVENAAAGVAMEVAPNLNVGIGTQSPTTKLQVAGGDMDTSDAGAGLIVKSPDGTSCARIGIDNTGAIVATPVTCP